MITLISVLALLLALTGWQVKSQYDRAEQAEAQIKPLVEALDRAVEREKRDRKLLVARQAKIASQARELASVMRDVSEALERNKTWSDTHVPPDVQKALTGPE